MKARRRNAITQMHKNLQRIEVKYGRIMIDSEVIGEDRFDNNEEAHFVHYWLSQNLHNIEHALIVKHLEKVEGEDR